MELADLGGKFAPGRMAHLYRLTCILTLSSHQGNLYVRLIVQ